ncbi:hypothetical protein V2O64_06480 [Verrucomicrobiaceae bacterium 227]
MKDEAKMLFVEKDPTLVFWVLTEVFNHLGQGGVGWSRLRVAIKKAQWTTVSIHPFEPLDATDPLGDAHGVGFHQGMGLGVGAF